MPLFTAYINTDAPFLILYYQLNNVIRSLGLPFPNRKRQHKCFSSFSQLKVRELILDVKSHFTHTIFFFLCSAVSSRRILPFWANTLLSMSSRLLPAQCREVLLPSLSLLRNYNHHWCHVHHGLLK